MKQNATLGGFQQKKNCVFLKKLEKKGGRWIFSQKVNAG